jgi:RNA polymerase sigma-70 factor (ECF subfamily)
VRARSGGARPGDNIRQRLAKEYGVRKGPNERSQRTVRGMTDAELIALVARRDEPAMRLLYRRYAPHLMALALRMTPDGDEAERSVQAVFERVWELAGRFESSRSSAGTWLVTVGHRLIVNRLRERRRRQAGPGEPGGRLEPPSSAGKAGRIYLPEALDALDPESRRLLELAFFGGHTQQQLAELTGLQPIQVSATIWRGLGQLRAALAGATHDD